MEEVFHVLKTKAFRKIRMDFVFPCERSDAFSVYGNLLIRLLAKKTNKYQTEEEFASALIEHYVMDFSITKITCGENWFYIYHIAIADAGVLKDKNYDYQKTLSFLMDAIYNPYTKENAFYDKEVENEKEKLNIYIESGFKNINSYAQMRIEELLDDKGYFQDAIYKHQEDIEKVSSEDLYSYYQEVIKKKHPLVFVAGNVDDAFVEILKNAFPKSLTVSSFLPYQVKPFLVRDQVNSVEEKGEYNQSILKFAYKIENYMQEDEVMLSLLNFLLSSQSSRILSEYLRDRDKLVYTASSNYHACHGLFIINALIYREKKKIAKETIQELMEKLQDVTFISERIESVKERKRLNLERQKDSFASIMGDFEDSVFQTSYPLSKEYAILKKITPQEFILFVKRLKLDTIYYLEGSKDE